jgi:6-phosphogluconolactonase
VIYKVNGKTGKLDYVGHEPTQGKNPRSFGIDATGTFLIAANQSSSNLVSFRLNPKTGGLRATGTVVEVPTPVCVKIITS